MIPDEAVYAAAFAVYGSGFDGSPQRDAWLRDFRTALEAAAPLMMADLTADSPRLPSAARNELFTILGDFMEEFELESRVKGPSRHYDAPGYEWGDMCGYFERRIVAVIRAVK